MMQQLWWRLRTAILTLPSTRQWLYGAVLLLLYGLVYLPIGLGVGFLQVDLQRHWITILQITATALIMPGVVEEFVFRGLLIPHPREAMSTSKRWFYIAFSWVLFLLYHLHPWVPLFFRTPAFLLGAGLVGLACTAAYLLSGSLWLPVVIHWLIVTTWFLVFGGLGKFQG